MAMSAERKAARKLARDNEKRLNKLTSIAHQCKVELIEGVEFITVDLQEGTTLSGPTERVNVLLERMGLRPVRTTRNMLNAEAGLLVIDINTPNYCDVGSEAYWSM